MIKIKPIPKHDFHLVGLPSEKLGSKDINSVLEVTDGKKEYEVIEYYSFTRNEMFPAALMCMVAGTYLTHDEVFGVYRNSRVFYILLVKEKENDTE